MPVPFLKEFARLVLMYVCLLTGICTVFWMASKLPHFDSHFQDILDNIDIKLIAPFLRTLEIVSAEDQVELEKKSKKQAVKFMLRKVKEHVNGDSLFKNCLKKTNHSEGHLKILSLVYKMDSEEAGTLS